MVGDIIFINGHAEVIVSEAMITGCCPETTEEERARMKIFKPMPTYQYMSVKSRPV